MSTEYEVKRQEYLAVKLCHRKFYLWVAEYIRLDESCFPSDVKIKIKQYIKSYCTSEELKAYIKQLPLDCWDKQDFNVRNLAYAKGIETWNLLDTVCVLKVAVDNYLENLK